MSWIKYNTDLDSSPEVVRMASLLKVDEYAVTGRLLKLWSWADRHSLEGRDLPVTADFLDRLCNFPGFAAALREVGWLEGRDQALSFPRFDRHNGQTAKARAQGAQRKARSRSGPENVTPEAGRERDQRREEKNDTGSLFPQDEPAISATPSSADVHLAGQTAGVPAEICEAFYHRCESRPLAPSGRWTDHHGTEMRNWRAGLAAFAASWKSNVNQRTRHAGHPKPPPSRNRGTANDHPSVRRDFD